MCSSSARSRRSFLENSRSRSSQAINSFSAASRKRSRGVSTNCPVMLRTPSITLSHYTQAMEPVKGSRPRKLPFGEADAARCIEHICVGPSRRAASEGIRRNG
jgi:hypothetical protein